MFADNLETTKRGKEEVWGLKSGQLINFCFEAREIFFPQNMWPLSSGGGEGKAEPLKKITFLWLPLVNTYSKTVYKSI